MLGEVSEGTCTSIPCGIHFRNSFLANITEFFKQLCGGGSEFQGLCFEFVSRAIQETRTCEMFFKRYRSHRIEFPNWAIQVSRSEGAKMSSPVRRRLVRPCSW